MIKFKIDDKIYFLKEVDEPYDNYTKLYQYIPIDDKGHYKTECLAHYYGGLNVSDYITRKNGQTYRDIDKTKFWAALAWHNFGEAVGMNAEDIKIFKREKQKIECKNRIAALEQSLTKERLHLFILENPESYNEPTIKALQDYVKRKYELYLK